MLVKMAEAIGRVVLAGRELTRLAGYSPPFYVLDCLEMSIQTVVVLFVETGCVG